uniref:Large ribosomal subunit protein mL52 n=1 Tax=Terrapene triunguis TaxID=2587831 RepID=A0A674J219_9SAUR
IFKLGRMIFPPYNRVANQAVEQRKIQQGLDPSLEGYECLSDLPDWSFVDGCPTPSGKGQIHRKQDNEAFVRWVGHVVPGQGPRAAATVRSNRTRSRRPRKPKGRTSCSLPSTESTQ